MKTGVNAVSKDVVIRTRKILFLILKMCTHDAYVSDNDVHLQRSLV